MNFSKELLTPIHRLTLASIAVATLNFFYLSSVNSSPVANHQHHMQDIQETPHQKSSGLIATTAINAATVKIEGFQFKPNNVTLKKGGKVTFINHDAAPHTATPVKAAQFTGTGQLRKGESKTVVFNTVGAQNYLCEFHPNMKGKITVVN